MIRTKFSRNKRLNNATNATKESAEGFGQKIFVPVGLVLVRRVGLEYSKYNGIVVEG